MTQTEDSYTDRGRTLRLLRFLHRETAGSQGRIIITSLAAGLSRGAILTIFNAAAAESGARTINIWLVMGFAAALAVFLLTDFESSRASDRLIRTMIRRMRLDLCNKVLVAQLRSLEIQGPGKVFAQMNYDIGQLAAAASTFLSGFQSLVILVFALIYLGWISVVGLACAVVTIVASAAAYYWQDWKATLSLRRARESESKFFDAMYDLLHGFKEIKLGRAQQGDISNYLEAISDENRRLGAEAASLYRVSLITSQAFTFALIAILVFVLPLLVPNTSTSIYQFLATILFVIGPAEQLVSSIPSVSQASIALDNVERLDRSLSTGVPAITSQAAEHRSDFRQIALRDVHFRFEGSTELDGFDLGPINLELGRGEILFICGGNGSGKTTLLKLITGLYAPSSGAVWMDGRKISASDYQTYREMFAVVFSDIHLFRRLYGVDDPDPLVMDALLTELQIADKTQLKEGAFTSVDLSTGQRKRLAYAVSRLRDRQIYVFDEFAADQDPSFRRYFYTVLLPDLKRLGKTVVAVTHDDRWFGACDRLIKLEYGKIAGGDVLAPVAGSLGPSTSPPETHSVA